MPTTQAQANMNLIRRAFSAFNAANLEQCVTLLTEDFAINLAGMPFQMRGREAWMSNAEVMQIAFPGIKLKSMTSSPPRTGSLSALPSAALTAVSSWASHQPVAMSSL